MPNRARQAIPGGSALLLIAGVLTSEPALAGGEAAIEARLVDGQYACIDPATGQLASPDQSPECAAAIEAARAQEVARMRAQDKAAEGLEEQPLEGGGAKVDLNGQFRQNQVLPRG